MKKFNFTNGFRKGQFISLKKPEVIENIPLSKLFYFTLLINLFSIAGILTIQKRLPPEIPLFYGLAEGEDQLSARLGLLAPSLISAIITLANLLFALLVGNVFLKRTLIAAGFCVSTLSLLTTIQIIFLVGGW